MLTKLLAVPAIAAFAFAQTGFPPPPTPAGNPVTADKVALGKTLFWDEQLSSTRTVACGSCHILANGGADPRAATSLHPGPDGVFGTPDDRHASPGVPRNNGGGTYTWTAAFGVAAQVTPRTAPSVINAAYLAHLFWDGRTEDGVFRDPITNQIVLNGGAQLENLIAFPPVDTVEMGHPGRTWSDVVARVQTATPLRVAASVPPALQTWLAGRSYPQLFQQAFGSPGVTAPRIIMAIASYVRTLVSDESPVDRFFAGLGTLSPAESAGFALFATHCRICHANIPAIAGPTIADFRNSGVRPIGEDSGRGAITGAPGDAGAFKVPDLRNVARRSRFFHDGSQGTLTGVVDFYNRGGDFHTNQDPNVTAITNQLSTADRADLVAFLQALTDPRVQNETPPFDRPHLFTEGVGANVGFGAGTAGTGGQVPRGVAVEPATLGAATVTIALDRAQPNQLAVIAWDVAAAPATVVVAGLNVDLGLSPALVLLFAGITQGTTPGTGHTSWTFAVPPQPSLQGFALFGQWLATDPAGPGGLVTSNAFGLTVL